MVNERINNRDLRRHGDHIGTLANAANTTGDKSAGAMLNVASLFMHAVADARELESRVERLEQELTQVAALLQDALIIGQVKHIGILECAYALRKLLAQTGGEIGNATEADAMFFDEGADEYIEKAGTQQDVDQETKTVYLAIARMNRDAAKAIRFASKHMACERFDTESDDAD